VAFFKTMTCLLKPIVTSPLREICLIDNKAGKLSSIWFAEEPKSFISSLSSIWLAEEPSFAIYSLNWTSISKANTFLIKC
jgi:hypothetical protein